MIFTQSEIDWEYSDYLPEYSNLVPNPWRFGGRGYEYSMIMHFAQFEPTDIVADIGGGRSYFLPFISKFIKLGYVIDLGLEDSLGGYKDWYETYFDIEGFREGKFVSIKHDAMSLPFRDNYLDKAVTISVFEHIDFDSGDPEGDIKAAKEVYRALKPGGMFLGTVDFNPTTERPFGDTGGRVYTYESFERRIIEPTRFELLGERRKMDPIPSKVDYSTIPLFFVLVKPLQGTNLIGSS